MDSSDELPAAALTKGRLNTTLESNWYGTAVRKLHLDYHVPEWMCRVAETITVEGARQQARMFREAGVEAVEFFAYDHHGFCLFSSQHGINHPGLAQDYTGNMAAALRGEGIRTISYVNVFGSFRLGERHPDWVVRLPDGSRPSVGPMLQEGSQICASSPYIAEYFLPLLREVIERFDMDAIWLDGGSWLVETLCACDYCAAQFAQATGLNLPVAWPARPRQKSSILKWSLAGPPQPQPWTLRDDAGDEDERWVAWRIWRRGQIKTLLDTVVGAAREVKPSILITDNNSGRWSMPIPQTAGGRFVRWLTPGELGIDFLSCDPVPVGGNHEVILSREGRHQATTGLPFDFMNERFHKWSEWQLRSGTDFLLEFATILAVGGTCFFADQPYTDGSLEPAIYEELRKDFEWVRQREPWVRGFRMVPDVAILASAPSQVFGPYGNGRDAGRSGHGLVGSELIGSRTDRVEGAHLVTVEQGMQSLIYDEATLREHLHEQTAVIVPEQCLLEEATIESLEAYVEDGGRLLVTGRSGYWDEQYRPHNHTRLYDLLGVRVEGDLPAPIHYMRLLPAFRDGTAIPDIPLQCWGTAVKVIPVDAAELACLVSPREEVWRDGIQDEGHWRHYCATGSPPPGREVVGPAITLRRVGKGQALYVSVDPFAAYRHEAHHLAHLMLARLMELLAPADARRVSASKPLHVELSLQRKDNQLVVHLVNYFAQKYSTALVHNEEIIPVRDIVIRVRSDRKPARVMAQPEGIPLDSDYSQGIVTAWVPELNIHTMVVIE